MSRSVLDFMIAGQPTNIADALRIASVNRRRRTRMTDEERRVRHNERARERRAEAKRAKEVEKKEAKQRAKQEAEQRRREEAEQRRLRQREEREARRRERELRRIKGAQNEVRYYNTEISTTYVTGLFPSYSEGMRDVAMHYWASLPAQWKREGVDVTLYYDFLASDTYPQPVIQQAGLPLRYDSDGVALSASTDGGKYNTHTMTRLVTNNAEASSLGLEADLDDGEATCRSSGDFLELVQAHLRNRINLMELYDSGVLDRTIRGALTGGPLFFQPNHVTFNAHRRRLNTNDVAYGDRQAYLFREILDQNDGGSKNTCLWRLLVKEFGSVEHLPLLLSVEQMMERACLGPKIRLCDLDHIESTCLWTEGKRNKCKSTPRGICVYDSRLNLRRLPEYHEAHNKKIKQYANVVFHNGHFYGFQNTAQANSIRQNSLTFFGAFLKAAAWPNKVENLVHESWDLFRETQHIQPDMKAIETYICHKLGLEEGCVVQLPATSKAYVWKPWFEQAGMNGDLVKWMQDTGQAIYFAEKPGRELYPCTFRKAIEGVCKHKGYIHSLSDFKKIDGIGNAIQSVVAQAPWDCFKPSRSPSIAGRIEAKGLEARCDSLSIAKYDTAAIKSNWKEIEGMGLTFKATTEEVHMEHTLCMDIETCSVDGSNGHFLTYAIGYRHMGEKVRLVAETAEDLRGGLMWKALQAWQQIAERINDEAPQPEDDKEVKRIPFYIYAYNGSRFDHIDCIHSILANSSETPTDQLESNGKFISFKWQDLIFRDACLITMSSLSSACTAFAIETSKGSLPHLYLQNCKSEGEILARIHGRTSWGELEPYMQWFSETSDAELHHRKAGRSYEEWRDQQPLRQFWVQNKGVEFSFRHEMEAYLEKDVDALWELCDKLGAEFHQSFGIDIRKKCTLGSVAEHIWSHTLLKPIPKLATKEQHDLWQAANRGGFCGALDAFDHTARDGTQIYKVDITSLYPASACPIKYETEAGVQEPIGEWYTAFPDPSDGWMQRVFGGVEMTDDHYEELANMHGIVRISFDQSHLAFPFFLKKMSHKEMETLAPVLEGSESYTIPHIRMAYKYGVKIRLHMCEYCTKTREVYGEYMGHFAEVKNGADGVLKALKVKYGKTEMHEWSQEDKDAFVKATYDRTIAKLFLNGLLGRNNMKLDRKQTLLTRDPNDITCMRSDGTAYRGVEIQDITCGDSWAYRASFKEGGYDYHIKQFNVCPYLSAYMLGYSKMLMQASFQHIAEIGATPLYTDTDSIAFAATPEMWASYKDRFVPDKKTFGGMELEGVYKRLVTVGPKKYCCVKEDGSYDWACNGLPARSNPQTDVLSQFERVLAGETVSLDYFSIKATSEFNLCHTTEAKKQLRFLSLKGRVENGAIRWWKNEREFIAYASGVTPAGWEKEAKSAQKKAMSQIQSISGDESPAIRLETTQLSDLRKAKKVGEPDGRAHYVYVLRDVQTKTHSYVGYTNDLEERLSDHNGGAGRGSMYTAGRQWEYYMVLRKFVNRKHALKFESLLHQHSVARVEDWLEVATHACKKYSEYSAVKLKTGFPACES